ncbi:hypothetical protein Y032_0065g3657 [Ancylostoma ceylanicum]|uniref:Uncharacterized protein n=1 Tax=Ancylostoma ceylanicum TaxID=53326 RepID=A0A016U219_9BILA|nr:hypothetical protein Y032_0065g3657 [Ancylostoma ceylanicum]
MASIASTPPIVVTPDVAYVIVKNLVKTPIEEEFAPIDIRKHWTNVMLLSTAFREAVCRYLARIATIVVVNEYDGYSRFCHILPLHSGLQIVNFSCTCDLSQFKSTKEMNLFEIRELNN